MVGFGSVRAEDLKRASFNLWKSACLATVGPKGSGRRPLEAQYKD